MLGTPTSETKMNKEQLIENLEAKITSYSKTCYSFGALALPSVYEDAYVRGFLSCLWFADIISEDEYEEYIKQIKGIYLRGQ